MDFLEGYFNILPLLAPVDNVATETKTAFINLKNAQAACFLMGNGLLTSATATDMATISIEAATALNAAETAIAFNYRKAGAVGANTWGDTATAAATGIELDPAADDGKFVLIDVSPEWVQSQLDGAYYVRLSIGTAADMAAHLCSVTAFIKPRYSQDTMQSATAAATS